MSTQDSYGASDDPNIASAAADPQGDPADAGQVQDAALQHLQATDPADTEQHVASQLQAMAPAQADGLAGMLLNQLQQQGVDVNGLCARLGIDPAQAGGYLSQLMGLLHQDHPGELAQAASRLPDIAGLLAHPSVGGVLGALASRFLGR